MNRPSLNELGLRHGTDKGPKNHNYLRHYERYFAPRRDEPLVFLELGVRTGQSLRMWLDYFPNATLWCLDCDETCAQYVDYAPDRTHFRLGDQSDGRLLAEMAAEAGGFDIVLDDASHNGDGSRASFEHLYPHVRPSGLYFVEDLHTSYWGWGSSFVEYAKTKLDAVINAGESGHADPRNHPEAAHHLGLMDAFQRQTMAIHAYQSLLVFLKWPQEEVY